MRYARSNRRAYGGAVGCGNCHANPNTAYPGANRRIACPADVHQRAANANADGSISHAGHANPNTAYPDANRRAARPDLHHRAAYSYGNPRCSATRRRYRRPGNGKRRPGRVSSALRGD